MYLFHIYSSDILQKREFDLCVANSKKQRKYEPLFIYTFLFYSSAARWVAFFWSRRVALWTGRQLFKPRTKVQALLLASIRLTAKKKAKKKAESLPVGTWVSALTSLREDKQSTRTMINERSDYYLISAIGSQGLSPWVWVCFFFFLLILVGFS